MICPDCKNNNPDGFDYCLKCGKVLNASGAVGNTNENIPADNLQNLSKAETASQEGSREIKNTYQAIKEDAYHSTVETMVAPVKKEEKKMGKRVKFVVVLVIMAIILLAFIVFGGILLFRQEFLPDI